MKVIDHTPYFSPDGKINMLEKTKATMKHGSNWVLETQAQPGVIAILERELDKKFTLLRNVTLPGLEISIPLILVGPAGIYAMYVTALRGMYQAKGDQWGTFAGEKFSPAQTNLLTRTNRMARAVQIYLQKQGIETGAVDSALLCADPGMHVDSVRPIVRVVQSDALERFATTIAQQRAMITPDTVGMVVNRILNPKSAQPAQQVAPDSLVPTPEPAAVAESEPYVPAFAMPEEEQPAPQAEFGKFSFEFKEEPAAEEEKALPFSSSPEQEMKVQVKRHQRKGFSARQWMLLVLVALVECALLIVFILTILNTSNGSAP